MEKDISGVGINISLKIEAISQGKEEAIKNSVSFLVFQKVPAEKRDRRDTGHLIMIILIRNH
jgi:hypothetical protein